MKKPLAIVLGLILLGAGIVVIIGLAQPRELVFQGNAVSAWAFQLYGPVRREEAQAIFRQLDVQTVPDLVRMLRSKDPLLTKMLFPPPVWLPLPLQQLIRRSIRPADASARRIVAANAIASLGPKASAAVPALAVLLCGDNPDERWPAATALGRIGSPAAIEVCVSALRSPVTNLHHAAVYALGEMGTNAAPALPEVLGCLGHPLEEVRASASHTLTQIGTPALEPLLERVRGKRGIERRAAAQVLPRICSTPRIVLPPLLIMLDDPDPESRHQALESLLAVAPWHQDVARALTNLVHDTDERIRSAAAEALARSHGQQRAPNQP